MDYISLNTAEHYLDYIQSALCDGSGPFGVVQQSENCTKSGSAVVASLVALVHVAQLIAD